MREAKPCPESFRDRVCVSSIFYSINEKRAAAHEIFSLTKVLPPNFCFPHACHFVEMDILGLLGFDYIYYAIINKKSMQTLSGKGMRYVCFEENVGHW